MKVPPGAEDWGDRLGSKTMEIAPTGMVVGVRATRRPSRHRPFDDVESSGRCFVHPRQDRPLVFLSALLRRDVRAT